MSIPYRGSRVELMEVIAMPRADSDPCRDDTIGRRTGCKRRCAVEAAVMP